METLKSTFKRNSKFSLRNIKMKNSNEEYFYKHHNEGHAFLLI